MGVQTSGQGQGRSHAGRQGPPRAAPASADRVHFLAITLVLAQDLLAAAFWIVLGVVALHPLLRGFRAPQAAEGDDGPPILHGAKAKPWVPQTPCQHLRQAATATPPPGRLLGLCYTRTRTFLFHAWFFAH